MVQMKYLTNQATVAKIMYTPSVTCSELINLGIFKGIRIPLNCLANFMTVNTPFPPFFCVYHDIAQP